VAIILTGDEVTSDVSESTHSTKLNDQSHKRKMKRSIANKHDG
jgi:hypothetical protein